MKKTFKKIAKSLTGFSTPVFGVSWNPPQSEREIVRKLITFLEDRRALYNPYNMETPLWVMESILAIRERFTETLQTLPGDSDISPHLRAIRAACRKFMDQAEQPRRRHAYSENIFAALGEMRAIIGIHVAQLCVKYGTDVEGDLASILPVEDTEQECSRTEKNKTTGDS